MSLVLAPTRELTIQIYEEAKTVHFGIFIFLALAALLCDFPEKATSPRKAKGAILPGQQLLNEQYWKCYLNLDLCLSSVLYISSAVLV